MNKPSPINRFLPWRYIMRLRCRAGYGVQSPSRYYFIRHVLYQRLPYYAYSILPRVHGSSANARLLFRLANYTQAKETIIFSDLNTNKAKIQSKALETVFYEACHSSVLSVISMPNDALVESVIPSKLATVYKAKCFLYIEESLLTEDLYDVLVKHLIKAPKGTLLVVEEIYASKEYYHRWLDFIQKLRTFGLSFAAYEMNKKGLLLLDDSNFSKVFII